MTTRDRFRAALNCEKMDRLPAVEWATYWDKTLRRWETEGLPAGLDQQKLYDYFGLDQMYQYWLHPRSGDGPYVNGEWLANIQDESDYERLLPYLYRDESIEEMVHALKKIAPLHESGKTMVWLTLEGFFWFPRQLLGIERHLYAFYDTPELLHRINHDQADFCLRAIDAACSVLCPEFMTFAEDMSYNLGPMISHELYCEFMDPYYKKVIPRLKEYGVRVLIDTDGFAEPLIPWFMESGIEGILPLERQAGVDVTRIRSNFPQWIMIGGYDKMIMHLGEEAMRNEFERILPAMRSGRYIPSVDHQTPPDVSIENYRIYLRLLDEYCRKAAVLA